jgi:epoxyqueuosine reductase
LSGGEPEVRVPAELLTGPGTAKNRAEEAFFNQVDPEPEWLTHSRPGKAMELLEMAFTKERPEIKRVWGERIAMQQRAIAEMEAREPSADPSDADFTDELKAEARRLGFDAVGITRFHRAYVYSTYRRQVRHRTLIMLGLERPAESFDEEMLSIRFMHTTQQVMHEGTEKMLRLAELLQRHGRRSQIVAGPIGVNLIKVLPYAEEAGLGQMGLNGQLLSPWFGSRWHPFAMSTDARLRHDQPRDFGVRKLCDACQVCVRRCPGRAIPNLRVHWRGAHKNKLQVEKCVPMLMKYATCNICTRVCPVQKYGLQPVLDHYEATGGEVLGKGTEELEGYSLPDRGHFGVGELPHYSKDEARIRYDLLDRLPTGTEPWVHQVSSGAEGAHEQPPENSSSD